MSKINVINECSIDELMKVVRKYTQPSNCIDTFECLLKEIKDKSVIKTAVADMNRFIEEAMLVFHDVDRMENIRFKSKMLSDDFICPERFFKASLKNANHYLYLNAALNYEFMNNEPSTSIKFVLSNVNRLDKNNIVWKKQYFEKKSVDEMYHNGGLMRPDEYYEKHDKIVKKLLIQHNITEDSDDIREECRKIVLLWNYMPAIVKAIIQTKRRSLNLDKNSSKFE